MDNGINSKNIIAFGKTGNYGLKKDFGVNKSSELSTKNILKVILNKNKNTKQNKKIQKK